MEEGREARGHQGKRIIHGQPANRPIIELIERGARRVKKQGTIRRASDHPIISAHSAPSALKPLSGFCVRIMRLPRRGHRAIALSDFRPIPDQLLIDLLG